MTIDGSLLPVPKVVHAAAAASWQRLKRYHSSLVTAHISEAVFEEGYFDRCGSARSLENGWIWVVRRKRYRQRGTERSLEEEVKRSKNACMVEFLKTKKVGSDQIITRALCDYSAFTVLSDMAVAIDALIKIVRSLSILELKPVFPKAKTSD